MEKQYKIDSDIYLQNNIIETISDFSEVSDISYNNWKLNIVWDNESEIEEVFNEFMNYLISNINENN
jgi:hypothetical protein